MQTDSSTPAHSFPQAFWIERQRLGALEQILEELDRASSTKRGRVVQFHRIERVLKDLKLIPAGTTILRLGLGCNYLGQRGLMIEFLPTEQVITTVPSQGNFAQERKDSCTG